MKSTREILGTVQANDIAENTRDIADNASAIAKNARDVAWCVQEIIFLKRLLSVAGFVFSIIFLLLMLTSCGGGVSYGAPYIALEPPPHRRGVRVQGNDCTYQSAFGNARDVSVRTAMEHALEGTGSTALVDVEITTTDPPEFCIEVEGVTVR